MSADNVKAHFRLAQALHGRRDFEQALETLAVAQKLAPNDKAILAEIAAVKREIQAYKDKEKRAFSKLFQ